jgi:hypothetical protein
MSNTSKQPKTTTPTDADLKGNPGINSSKGTTIAGEDPDLIEAGNTYDGDVMNETEPTPGGIDPKHTGRTNK